jgi:hypothetical protein
MKASTGVSSGKSKLLEQHASRQSVCPPASPVGRRVQYRGGIGGVASTTVTQRHL